jgi:sugar phosphate isomerase/epimerase
VQLGLASICALDRPLAAAAAAAAAAGLGGLEVTARPPHVLPDATDDDLRRAGEAIRAAGLEVLAYGSYLGHEGARDAAAIERAVGRTVALGARRLRVWAQGDADAARGGSAGTSEGGSAVSADAGSAGRTEGGFAGAVTWLRDACERAASRGVTVVVERHVGSFADTPERVERLFAAVDHPALALNYQVLDGLPPAAVPQQPDDARRLVPLARYVHLKNYRPGPEPDAPLQLGGSLARGVLDLRKLVAAILEAGYDGPMTIEFLAFDARPLEERLAADVAFLRDVLGGRRGP